MLCLNIRENLETIYGDHVIIKTNIPNGLPAGIMPLSFSNEKFLHNSKNLTLRYPVKNDCF